MKTFQLLARDDSKNNSSFDPTMVSLLISLLVLVILGLVCVGALFFLRKVRRNRKQADEEQLPVYEKRQSKASNHRRLTITAAPFGSKGRDSIFVYSEKQELMESPPASPVPEIRITFPDEVDESGKRQSGRVVVVRVGDHSVGLEPVSDDLPPYQRDADDRFDSLDLDRIGGLKEKSDKDYS